MWDTFNRTSPTTTTNVKQLKPKLRLYMKSAAVLWGARFI